MKRARTWILAALLVLALAWLVERLHVSDEEQVEAAWQDLIQATEDEDAGRLRARLAPAFAFRGPRMVGEGETDRAFEVLGTWWDQSSAIKVTGRSLKIDLQGPVARVEAGTLVRFDWGGGTALYRVRTVAAMQRLDERWVLRDLEVLELAPGLF